MTDRPDAHTARIAANHHGLFARHHLVELGVSPEERRHRLATGRWERVFDSAYRVGGAPISWHARCSLRAGPAAPELWRRTVPRSRSMASQAVYELSSSSPV